MDRRKVRVWWPVAVAVLVTTWGFSVAAASLPRLPGPLTIPQSADSPGPVTFNHASHVDESKPGCTTCHPREFRILKANAGKRPIRHDDMKQGRQCGACHDGKKAFAMTDDCTLCHKG